MFPGSISLALCTVVMRRCFDAFTGRIPAPVPVSKVANISTMFMVSGALMYLYSHLRQGTLVRIGQGHRNYSGTKTISVHGNKHNRSWFLKNLWGKRKCCTEAISKIAKQFSDSVTNLNPCLLLPKETFQVSFPDGRERFFRTSDKDRLPINRITCEREIQTGTNPFNDGSIINRDSCEIIFSKETESKNNYQKKALNTTKGNANKAGGDNVDTVKRKRQKSVVKRLEVGKGLSDETVKQSKQSNKFRSEYRRTRSGRVYNPFT